LIAIRSPLIYPLDRISTPSRLLGSVGITSRSATLQPAKTRDIYRRPGIGCRGERTDPRAKRDVSTPNGAPDDESPAVASRGRVAAKSNHV